jgi:hypothetical protein
MGMITNETPIELWRYTYEKEAYVDQTGLAHFGKVIHEQILVVETGKFSQWEYYASKKYDSGIVAESEDGRIFLGYANLVDYTGGRSWHEILVGDPEPPRGYEIAPAPGFWMKATTYTKGMVYKDGSAPIKPLLPS